MTWRILYQYLKRLMLNYVKLHRGWFYETLPIFTMSEHNEQIGFLHVDSDLYPSAKTALVSI